MKKLMLLVLFLVGITTLSYSQFLVQTNEGLKKIVNPVVVTNSSVEFLPIFNRTATFAGGNSIVPILIGTKSNTASAGLVLVGSVDNTGGVQIFADDGGAAAAQITSPIWTRYLLTKATQTSGATQTGAYLQLKTYGVQSFTTGDITAAKVYNQAGTVTLLGGASYGIINAGMTLEGNFVNTSGQLAGVDVNINDHGFSITNTASNSSAVLIRKVSTSTAGWPVGLKIGSGGADIDIMLQNGATISNATNGSISIVGALNHAIAGGSPVVSAGLLGGAGTSTSATQTIGAGGSNDKAFSYYLSSTSVTASHAETGFYMCMNYGTTAGQPGPSGDVVRGRAYLVGSASGGTMLSGGNFTTELAANTAANSGLTTGLKGNLVIPSGVMTGAGEFYGAQAELYISAASTDVTSYTNVSPLSVCVSGTNTTNAAQLGNVGMIDFRIPSNEIGNGLLFDTGSTQTAAGKLRIKINGAVYYILLTSTPN
jgi:hypothetical protein